MSETRVPGATRSTAPSRPRRTVREHGPDPIDVQVGRRLRQARLLAGKSQEELGDGVGVSFQAVQKYEQGENRLSASWLWRAAQFLQRPVSFFFDEIDGTSAAGPQTTFTRDEIDLVRHFRSIASEDVRDRLVQVAKRVGEVKDEGRDATGG